MKFLYNLINKITFRKEKIEPVSNLPKKISPLIKKEMEEMDFKISKLLGINDKTVHFFKI